MKEAVLSSRLRGNVWLVCRSLSGLLQTLGYTHTMKDRKLGIIGQLMAGTPWRVEEECVHEQTNI